MREIKFRAWDELNKRWLGRFGITHNGELMHVSGFRDDVVLMQYVGFNDIDNKDVYEGDLIQLVEGWCRGCKKTLNVIKQVRWLNSKGCWNVKPGEFKIMGNIYDNPELRKEVSHA